VAPLKINPKAIRNVSKIAGALGPLFNRTGKVSVCLLGDSTIELGGHGWDNGITFALIQQGIQQFGTGLHGVGESTGVGAHHSNTPNTQNGLYSALPAEWQNYCRNKSGEAGHLGLLDNWFCTANQAAGTFGVSLFGNNAYGYSRPAPFLAENLTGQLWYLTTTAATAGAQLTVGGRKETGSDQTQVVNVENFDGAIGGTFTLTFGAVTTGNITYNTTAATLQTNIKTAIETALPGKTVTVTCTTVTPGAFVAQIVFTAPAATDQAICTVNTGTLVQRFAGRPIETLVYAAPSGKGFYLAQGSDTVLDADSQASIGMARHDRSFAASAARDWQIGFQLNKTSTCLAPWVSLFAAFKATDRTTGFALTPIMYVGGQPARIHATRLQAQTVEFLGSLFQAIAEHAGAASPAVHPILIRITDGANDRSDSTLSVGPSPAASNTQAGFYDNLLAIVNRIEAVYAARGWSTANLFFYCATSTPLVDGDADMAFARAGANQLSDVLPRFAAYDPSKVHEGFATDVTGLAYSGADFAHCSVTGFKVWSEYEMGSMREAYLNYTAGYPTEGNAGTRVESRSGSRS